MGSIFNLLIVVKNLFEVLRKCDDLGVDLILVEGYE